MIAFQISMRAHIALYTHDSQCCEAQNKHLNHKVAFEEEQDNDEDKGADLLQNWVAKHPFLLEFQIVGQLRVQVPESIF